MRYRSRNAARVKGTETEAISVRSLMGTGATVAALTYRLPDVQHPHHLVVLMGEDVAVPHIAARLVECGPDPGDLAG